MQITHKRQESSEIRRERKRAPAATRACHLMSQLKFNAKLMQTHIYTHIHTHSPTAHTYEGTQTGACCTLYLAHEL